MVYVHNDVNYLNMNSLKLNMAKPAILTNPKTCLCSLKGHFVIYCKYNATYFGLFTSQHVFFNLLLNFKTSNRFCHNVPQMMKKNPYYVNHDGSPL